MREPPGSSDPAIGKLRVGEGIQVVDRPNETRNQTPMLQVGERVAADAVMGVEDIEVAGRRRPEMNEVVVDAGPHELDRVTGNGAGGDGHRGACGGPEETTAGRVRRVDHRLVPEPAQGFSEGETMGDAAAWVGRMGQEGDAQTGHAEAPASPWPQPISGPATKVPDHGLLAPGIPDAGQPARIDASDPGGRNARSAKRARTVGVSPGRTLRR